MKSPFRGTIWSTRDLLRTGIAVMVGLILLTDIGVGGPLWYRWNREYGLAIDSLRAVLGRAIGEAYMNQDLDQLTVLKNDLKRNQGIELTMVDLDGRDMLTRTLVSTTSLAAADHSDAIIYIDPRAQPRTVGTFHTRRTFNLSRIAFAICVIVQVLVLAVIKIVWPHVTRRFIDPLEAIKDGLQRYAERDFSDLELPAPKTTTQEIENLRETLIRLDERLQDNNRRIQEASEKEARSVALRDIFHGIRGMVLKVSGPASSLQKWLDRRPDLPADDRLRIEAQIRLLGQVADHIRAYTDRIQASMSDSPDADLPVHLAVVRVQDLVARLDADYAIVCAGENHRWTVDQPAESVAIRADRLVLFNQFDSLLRNAVSALSAQRPEGGGHLALEVVRQDGQVQFSITDDGPGLDESTVRAFHREQRLPSRKGWGVGLIFARRYIRLMGGTIEHRVPEGGGTRFVIRFEEVPLA